MKRTTAFAVGGILAATIALSATAIAHTGAMGVVKDRMDNMEVLGDAVKALTAMFRGEVDFDEQTVREEAARIAEHAGEAMTALFPEGSIESPSEAKPEIWQDWETFEALAMQLETFGEGLALAAGNERSGMPGPNFMMNQDDSGQRMMMGQGMMGRGMMGREMMGDDAVPGVMMGQMPNGGVMPEHTPEFLGQMPPDMVFGMVVQTCSACHTQFRAEQN